MKDEAAGKPILEFIGLRPKMYSFMIAQDKLDPTNLKEKHVAKGIQRAVIANLRHEDYRAQLDTPAENTQINRRIGTQLHQLYTFATHKRGLCAYDDKRYMVDNVNTLAYGHHRIPVPQVAVDMHPNGPVDAGMIVLAHQESRRAMYKRSHQRIIQAAAGTPTQDAACAAEDELAGDEPPSKRAATTSLREEQNHDDGVGREIAETSLLNTQSAQHLQDVGDLPENDDDDDEDELDVSQDLFL